MFAITALLLVLSLTLVPVRAAPRKLPAQTLAARPFTTTCAWNAPKIAQTQALLTRDLLHDLRGFWYEHVDEDGLVLPGWEENKRWYQGGEEFDRLCVQRYAPTLEALRSSGATAADVLEVAQPQEPLDWLALVLLLDQMPRNAYRGASSSVVFERFDPIAREIATTAIARGIPDAPEVRWQLGYRLWFYLPLMHSEDLAMHEQAVKLYDSVVKDVESLLGPEDASWDHHRRKAARVAKAHGDEALKRASTGADFERRHQVIIQRFGRYPHRNEALGRKSTAEEEEYLRNGGETF